VGKKILTMLLGDKNGRKTLGCILGIAVVIVLLPIMVTVGLFGWMAGGGVTEVLTHEAVYVQLPPKVQSDVAQHELQLVTIENEFANAGFSGNDISKAKTIYISALVGKETEDVFYQNYITCFQNANTNAELLSNVSSAFGVSFSDADRNDFENLYGENQ
jgi:hypothetical protein